MATITLTDAVHYRDSLEFAYDMVGNGWESSLNGPLPTVARYAFSVPGVGASAVSLAFTKWYLETGQKIALRFYIGTDPESHINANPTYEYSGELSIQSDGVTIAGSAEVMLLPGRTYYLWIFPAENTYGLYGWLNETMVATMETIGSAGVVFISDGSDFRAYQPYIDTGTEWKPCTPYIDNGTGWDVCS